MEIILISSFLIIIILRKIIIYKVNKKIDTLVFKTNFNYDKKMASKRNNQYLKKYIPTLKEDIFYQQTFEIYKQIQIAWMNFDLDTIRNLVSDEIYNMYSMQLETLKLKGQQNIMKNIKYINAYIDLINIENNTLTISEIMLIKCKDYIINSNNKVIRGDKKQNLYYKYKLTFIKNLNKNITQCPNCSANIDPQKDTNCPYCNAIIPNNTTNWIMIKKEMIEQKKV